MVSLQTHLFDLVLPSPFVLASGPRSYGAKGIWKAYKAGAGAVVTKTICRSLPDNPTPHIVQFPVKKLRNTLFNAEEWADLPWEQWVKSEIPALEGHPGALIVSVGHDADGISGFIEQIVSCRGVDIIECVSYSASATAPLVAAIRKKTDIPILAKLSFNWGEQLFPVAEAALKAGCSGFTAIDSIGPGLKICIETGRPDLASGNGKGWVSGAAINPIALSIVADLKMKFGKPIVGTGGVFSELDVIEMTMAGADAIGVCSAPILQGNEWYQKTITKTKKWLADHNHNSLEEIVGSALPYLNQESSSKGLKFQFEPMLCTLCQRCVQVCPYDARGIIGERPKDEHNMTSLDDDMCRSCGLCSSVCPTGALTSSQILP
jgi:dihydroorotate dehydrogenase/NAD-dependent dihydropyrimidine dehydrogenase PreA subunit